MVKLLWVAREAELTPYDGSGNFYDGGNGTVGSENEPVYKMQAPELVFTAAPKASPTKESGGVRLAALGAGFWSATILCSLSMV